MLDTVTQMIEQLNMIEPGDVVVVGVSGGADSICLLLHLLEYKRCRDFSIEVVHVNHLIRDDASADVAFVKELCEKYGLVFHLYEEDVHTMAKEQGLSVEEAGRIVRYRAYREVLGDRKGCIALGHHRDDLVETVLFNMCRGTGIHGMVGIQPINGDIIRPLLNTDKEMIEEYLRKVGQEYRTDSTNLETDYSRNRIRHNIVPYLKDEINAGAVNHIASLSYQLQEIESYVNREVDKFFNLSTTTSTSCELCQLAKLDPFLQGEIILAMISNLHSGRKDITRAHVASILELCDKSGEKRVCLPYGIEAVKNYDRLEIRYIADEAIVDDKITISISKADLLGGVDMEVSNLGLIKMRVIDYTDGIKIDEKPYTKRFDYDKIECPIEIRNRMPGDYLTVNDKLQKKTLKDYYIDEKIPKSDRDKQLILADGSHVMWVFGHRMSSTYKISAATKKVLEVNIITR